MKEFPYFLKEISDFRHFQSDFRHSNLRCARYENATPPDFASLEQKYC